MIYERISFPPIALDHGAVMRGLHSGKSGLQLYKHDIMTKALIDSYS